jgi:hypothetical protein
MPVGSTHYQMGPIATYLITDLLPKHTNIWSSPAQLPRVPPPTRLSLVRPENVGEAHSGSDKRYNDAREIFETVAECQSLCLRGFDLVAGVTSKSTGSPSYWHPRIQLNFHLRILHVHLLLHIQIHFPLFVLRVSGIFSETTQIRDIRFLTNICTSFTF